MYILSLFLVAVSYPFEDVNLACPVQEQSECVCGGAGVAGEEMEEGQASEES